MQNIASLLHLNVVNKSDSEYFLAEIIICLIVDLRHCVAAKILRRFAEDIEVVKRE